MLEDCTLENTPFLSLEGLICECKVLSVYDADTITVAVKWKEDFYKVKCRLAGIDSAEKRTKNSDEKKVALEATKWVESILKNKTIWIKCGSWGKYGGRMIGTLFLSKQDLDNDKSFNQKIIEKGYAYIYSGKKKKKFEDWYVK
jgi:endonuclease YncB( thermonuclease family)